jgi:peptidoglycan hydrolase CwlO-like protein
MWVRFPSSTTAITIQQQNFTAEAKDAEGRHYARVPAHFTPHLLSMNMGFEICDPPADTDLPDLPTKDPDSDKDMKHLGQQLIAAQTEMTSMREDFAAMSAKLASTVHERDKLFQENEKLKAQIQDMEEAAEDKPAPAPAPDLSKPKK